MSTIEEKRKELNEKNISILQKNLSLIRKAAGWSAEDLAKKIGVSKPTILSFERLEQPTPMSTPIYISIMVVLADEIETRPTDDILRSVLGLIFETDELTDANRNDALAYISGLKIKEKNEKNIPIDNERVNKTLGLILGVGAFASIASSTLISKALSKKKE